MITQDTLRQNLIDTYKLQDNQWINIKKKYGIIKATFIQDGRFITAVYNKTWQIQ